MHMECRHIMADGRRCHSPALTDKEYCYFHMRNRHLWRAQKPASSKASNAVGKDALTFPVLEDRCAIQLALHQIVNAVGASKLDARRASLLLSALRIASRTVELRQDVLPYIGIDSFVKNREGEELAPELRICGHDDKCSACPDKATCSEFDPDDEEE